MTGINRISSGYFQKNLSLKIPFEYMLFILSLKQIFYCAIHFFNLESARPRYFSQLKS
jgi:hypothetical protein